MLFGVIMMGAVTFAFTIPANTFHWQMEIWKRGGAAWLFDNQGHLSWTWLVEPASNAPHQKRIIVPSRHENLRVERL